MLLTIETSGEHAGELGHVLHKHPARVHSFDYSFGQGHIFYPVTEPGRQQAALLLDVDPINLVRGKGSRATMQWALGQYVNDRPYAVSSLMSVFINKSLRSALKGESSEHPEMPARPRPLRAELCAVVCQDGPEFLEQLFAPLGYKVTFQRYPLDEVFPQWGPGVAYKLCLEAHGTVSDLLTHLYVLIPVLDNEKHYWVGEDEVEKLLERGRGWLEQHPLREVISRRFLKHQRALAIDALSRLSEDGSNEELTIEQGGSEEGEIEKPLGLQSLRIETLATVLKRLEAVSVVDLGCGSGDLLMRLAREGSIQQLAGLDVSAASLAVARERLGRENLPGHLKKRVELLHGALTYVDTRISGFDAAVLSEVIEHLDPPRLSALERCVFEHARPAHVLVTTPNHEYNQLWPRLPAGRMRHRDHRFEWDRSQFQSWASDLAQSAGYRVRFFGVGPAHELHGHPTQGAVFSQ